MRMNVRFLTHVEPHPAVRLGVGIGRRGAAANLHLLGQRNTHMDEGWNLGSMDGKEVSEPNE